MNDGECVSFLRWALPRMGMRWRGFRKVRGQVCKRVTRRMKELGLPTLAEYRAFLETRPQEWTALDACCRITISRFFRDREVCRTIQRELLPALGRRAGREGRSALDLWSAGCGSGEEPYTLSLLWRMPADGGAPAARAYPDLSLRILATDAGPEVLERGRTGVYPRGCLKELPSPWVPAAFQETGDGLRLRDRFREGVDFVLHDVRDPPPGGPFDLIACRNMVFTYFQEGLQGQVLEGLLGSLRPRGYLVLGSHEKLPPGSWPLRALGPSSPLFQRKGAPTG
jgi:chemotaxis protein methyltransferase CheR